MIMTARLPRPIPLPGYTPCAVCGNPHLDASLLHDGTLLICASCDALPRATLVSTAKATAIAQYRHRPIKPGRKAVPLSDLRDSRRLTAQEWQDYYDQHGGKVCASCHQLKATEAYHGNTARPDGLHTECKACKALRRKARKLGTWPLIRNALRARVQS